MFRIARRKYAVTEGVQITPAEVLLLLHCLAGTLAAVRSFTQLALCTMPLMSVSQRCRYLCAYSRQRPLHSTAAIIGILE